MNKSQITSTTNNINNTNLSNNNNNYNNSLNNNINDSTYDDIINGSLYYHTNNTINDKKILIWCTLHTRKGIFTIYSDIEKKLLLHIFNIINYNIIKGFIDNINQETLEIYIDNYNNNSNNTDNNLIKDKIKIFSSNNTSNDIDYWYHTLLFIKNKLLLNETSYAPYLCSPISKNNKKLNNHSFINNIFYKLERFIVYESINEYYIIGSNTSYTRFRMIRIDRISLNNNNNNNIQLKDIIFEYKNQYTWNEMENIVQSIQKKLKNDKNINLIRTLTAVGIVGFIRFLRHYYIVFITQRTKIGSIAGHPIYRIQATHQLSLACHSNEKNKNNTVINENKNQTTWNWINKWFNNSPENEAEAKYLGLFHFIDLTKDFYYSCSYDITNTLQHNMTKCKNINNNNHSKELNINNDNQSNLEDKNNHIIDGSNERFIWNHYLIEEFKNILSPEGAADFIQPLVFGCYEQRKCCIFGKFISIILMARRSRHFAGTRYLKRGITDIGNVANEVEIEQVIEDENSNGFKEGKLSSFVQYRGSIPTFWTQETSLTLPKPPIVLNRIDPSYAATRKHFGDLFERYGTPIIVLNLVKQSEKREREVIVGKEFANAVNYINNFVPNDKKIQYIAMDYSRISKQKNLNVLKALDNIANYSINQTGFFCNRPIRSIQLNNNKNTNVKDNNSTNIEWLEQSGILRTNCIDCLDRTNVAQFTCGVRVLGKQLYALGLKGNNSLENRSQLVRILMHLYILVGDAISMQYGGSEAHKKVKNGTGGEKGKHREILTSIRRYYSNSFTDMAKQDAINIFLGLYIPYKHEIPLWELDSDYYLHNRCVESGCKIDDYMPMKISPLNENSNNNNIIGNNNNVANEMNENHLKERKLRKKLAIEKAKKYLEWWKEPLERRKKCKINISTNENTKGRRKYHETKMIQNKKNSIFYKPYYDKELTSFDEELGYRFMQPFDLSKDISTENKSNTTTNKTNYSLSTPTNSTSHIFSFSPSAPRLSYSNSCTFVHSSPKKITISPTLNKKLGHLSLEKIDIDNQDDDIDNDLLFYEQYIKYDENRNLWETKNEKEDQESLEYYTNYMNECNINVNDVKAVKEAQMKGGATYKIQGGVYAGLEQSIQARSLVSRTLIVDKNQEKFYKDSMSYESLSENANISVPKESKELYHSFYNTIDMEINDIKDIQINNNDINKIDDLSNINNKIHNNNNRKNIIGPIDALYRQLGNENEFILFNSAIIDNNYIEFTNQKKYNIKS